MKVEGKFKHILAFDCETTGLCFGTDNPVFNPDTGERHQAVSWGLIIADVDTLLPVEEMYVEIKWNIHSVSARRKTPSFGKKAEGIHGLTFDYLEENGVDEEEAVLQMGELVLKHFGPRKTIHVLGHNVITFDLPFFKDLFRRHKINLKFAHRHVDTNSLGFGTFGTYTSDQFFEECGYDPRGSHNALEDARMALGSARIVREIFKIGLNAL